MIAAQGYWAKVCLRLKLRQSSGDAFQGFFSDLMQKLHGDDFVRVRPFGSLGDKGCDGYLQSNGQLFQCYGALNGDSGKVDYLIGKMEDDFVKAKSKLSGIMKEWHMVHNLVDGLPIEALEKLDELRTANPKLKFGFVGLEGIEERLAQLADAQVEDLLGPLATNKDAVNLQVEELRDLINGVIEATAKKAHAPTKIGPVPVDKLDANNLPEHWRQLIAFGWMNAHIVATYIDHHPEPMVGETIASMFNERYQYLRSQSLPPGSIMDALYEYVVGIGSPSTQRQVAAQALLAYLFEKCDIFEDLSLGVAS